MNAKLQILEGFKYKKKMSNFIRAESKGRFLIYFKYEYSFVTKNGFREFKVPLSDFLKH